jgi:hypothetical protein
MWMCCHFLGYIFFRKHLKMSQRSIYKYLETKCFVDQLNNTNEQALLKLLQ